ncbi:hypothetical protein D917_05129 [Trichinella nativa]|uniref:Uncharacterized protein n=1 Tax=Trichinella nativa TaxID=6335 RepID=A0A1Y3EX04_9BILA|nr:hypothetical protein D917_05129 [Trichinella nativa]
MAEKYTQNNGRPSLSVKICTQAKHAAGQNRKCGPVCENLERANRRACMLDAGKFNSKNEESSSPSRRRRRNYTRSQPSHCTLNAANVLVNGQRSALKYEKEQSYSFKAEIIQSQ